MTDKPAASLIERLGSPRTDALLDPVGTESDICALSVKFNGMLGHARTLERELNQAAQALREAEERLKVSEISKSLIAGQYESAAAEIARLRLPPDETMSAHPGCVYCMEADTPVRPGEVCPRCGDRLPTKKEYRLDAAESSLAKHKELLEEIAEECEERGEADVVNGAYCPNAWMYWGTRIREFLKVKP